MRAAAPCQRHLSSTTGCDVVGMSTSATTRPSFITRVVERAPFAWMYHSSPVARSNSLRTIGVYGNKRWKLISGAFFAPLSGGSLVPSG